MFAIVERPITTPSSLSFELRKMGNEVYWSCFESPAHDSETFGSVDAAVIWARQRGWSVYGWANGNHKAQS